MYEYENEEYRRLMTSKGFEVLEPGPVELLLDLDWEPREGAPDCYIKELKKRLARLNKITPIVEALIKKSPEHYHGRVVMKAPLCFLERQAFEMMLGSDPTRAIHNLRHYSKREPYHELLSTLPGPWTKLEWTDEDAS